MDVREEADEMQIPAGGYTSGGVVCRVIYGVRIDRYGFNPYSQPSLIFSCSNRKRVALSRDAP